MRIPRSAASFLIALEALAMVVVLVLCIVHPWTVKPKNDLGVNNTEVVDGQQGEEENTENIIGTVVVPGPSELQEVVVTFSEEVLAKVDAMTLEQKIAQMFIISPEALTGADKVTLTGNTTKSTLNQYPVGGLTYSAINFQNKNQTINMLKNIQKHYVAQFGMQMFLIIAEQGGAETSPLATKNGYTVEAAPAEVGASADGNNAVSVATNISAYLKEAGFNTNLITKPEVYSQTTSVSSIMMAETIATFKQKGILTVMPMTFTDTMAGSESEGLAYKAGVDASVDSILLSNVTEASVKYLRANLQFGRVIMADSLAAEQVVPAILAGADVIYAPVDFKAAYQSVLDAVNAGTISEEEIDTAVARILTCKEALAN